IEPVPQPALSVAVALPKGDRGDWAVQKLTELGVDEIIVLDAARSVVRWDEDRASRGTARLSRIIRQAAMQARLTRLPRLSGPVTVAQVAADPAQACAAAEPGGVHAPDLAHPRVLIGPEGGWSEEELPADLARVGLGPTVLRTETAAVACATVLVLLRAGLLS
ncbi:MAG: RsmE family RNA methyltransferase, partial [Acidimicrobiales bacterium]